MSLLFNKQEPVFDKYGEDDDGWTREDHANLVKYGTKNPTPEMIKNKKEITEKENRTGRWF